MYEGAILAGKYRIEHVLGRGGMGVVVAATHLHLNTRVALKFLNDHMANDQKVVARFLREAQSCAQLKSEHVCRVIDFGMEGSIPYIVMELLEGTDLARLVKLRPLDVATAAEYVMQACMGLAEAHAARIVHRDLKPGNLMLTARPDGAPLVKVLDFGVAKVAENAQDFSLTQTTNVVGSPGFMSPEQLRSARGVDQRSDIWSLGVILYKIISGRQPFKAEALTDLAISIAMDPVPPLVEAPPAFAAIVMKCLEKDPANRYQNVTELGHALSRFTGGARPTTALFAPDESSIQQSYLMPHGAPPAVMPGFAGDYSNNRLTLTPEPPTTLQGATSSADLSAPVAPTKSRRGIVIGASAAIAIIIGIGIGVGASNTTAAVGTPTVVPGVRGDGATATRAVPPGTAAADTNDSTGGTDSNGSTAGGAGSTVGNSTTGAAGTGTTVGTTGSTGSNGGAVGANGATTGGAAGTAGTTGVNRTTAGTGSTSATGTDGKTVTVGSSSSKTPKTVTPVKKTTPTTSTPATNPKATTKPKDFGESRI